MGRPPLRVIRLEVRLHPEDVDRIDNLVGAYGRSGFIRDAVREYLTRMDAGEVPVPKPGGSSS